jgi:hypothetical protein
MPFFASVSVDLRESFDTAAPFVLKSDTSFAGRSQALGTVRQCTGPEADDSYGEFWHAR